MTRENTTAVELPLFPLNTVLYPNNRLPLRIFETRYVDLISRCMRDGGEFGIVPILNGSEIGRPAETHEIGTFAQIVDFDQGLDGLLNIVIRGGRRFEIMSTTTQTDNLLVGQVRPIEDVASQTIPQEYQGLVSLLTEIEANAITDNETTDIPTTGVGLAYRLAQYLPLPLSSHVVLLELDDSVDLLKRITIDVDTLREKSPE